VGTATSELERFRRHRHSLAVISIYLIAVADEAGNRGDRFDRSRIGRSRRAGRMTVTNSRLRHEFRHLASKPRRRTSDRLRSRPRIAALKPHPLFYLIASAVETWERGNSGDYKK
jgi:hypothetical protein